LAGRGIGVIAVVDGRAVDFDRYRLSFADTLDARPRAERTLDIILAAGIEQLFEFRVMQRPPELAFREDSALASFLPARLLVRPENDVAGELNRNGLLFVVLPSDRYQVGIAPLGKLALDAGHPRAAGAAVGADAVEQNAGVAHELAAVGLLA